MNNKINSLIEKLKQSYETAENTQKNPQLVWANAMRSTLINAVKLFWILEIGEEPLWEFDGQLKFNLSKAINDIRFTQHFGKWTIDSFNTIRIIRNNIEYNNYVTNMEEMENLFESLKRGLKTIENKLNISITNTNINYIKPDANKKSSIDIEKQPTQSQSSTILQKTKRFVLTFMRNQLECTTFGNGLTQAKIFKSCGFSWGNQENATESHQQYWIVACLKELESEGLIIQIYPSKTWKLTNEGLGETAYDNEFKGLTPILIGKEIKEQSKLLVLNYMRKNEICAPKNVGIRQSELFRACNLDWGSYDKANSAQQQYWIVGLLRTLENNGLIQRDNITKMWKLV